MPRNQPKNTITECSLTSGNTKWSRQKNHLTPPNPNPLHSQLKVAQGHVQLGFQRWRPLSLSGPPLLAFYFYVNNILKDEFANKAQNHSGTVSH